MSCGRDGRSQTRLRLHWCRVVPIQVVLLQGQGQTSARYKTGRSELAEGPEILHVSPVTGPQVGLWDGV